MTTEQTPVEALEDAMANLGRITARCAEIEAKGEAAAALLEAARAERAEAVRAVCDVIERGDLPSDVWVALVDEVLGPPPF